METDKDSVVLPVNSGLRDAYVAVLKSVYFEHCDNFWLSELINIVAADCGVSVETATDRCKQLVRFRLLKYLHSSLSGHRYIVLVFCRRGEVLDETPVSDWDEFNRLIGIQFSNSVETDLMKIRKSMNSLERFGLREKAEREVKSVFAKYDGSKPVIPGEDVVKSEFKTLVKETELEASERFLRSLRESSGNEGTSENRTVLEG